MSTPDLPGEFPDRPQQQQPPYGNQNPPMPRPSSYPGYPPPSSYGQPGYPAPGYGVDPQAPYGRDPATGVPLSDKSAVVAGVLQLFFGCFGVGRFYIGSTSIAVIQLCLGIFGVLTSPLLIGLPFLLGAIIWAIVDGIMMLAGRVTDRYGRKLRS